MNALLNAHSYLKSQLVLHPQMLLAYTVSMYDPLWYLVKDNNEEISGDSDPILIALQVTRTAFPDIYVKIVSALYRNIDQKEIERFTLKAFGDKGFDMDSLQAIAWGIPLNPYGVDLQDPDFRETHGQILFALKPFGIADDFYPEIDEDDFYEVEDEDNPIIEDSGLTRIYAAGNIIAQSLLKQSDKNLQAVGALYGWLFSCTGNTLVDNTYETMDGVEPLWWYERDIAFAQEIIQEADEIMADVTKGIVHLKDSPALIKTVTRHATRLLKQERIAHDNVYLHW